jgi:hypothetical protein
MKQEFDLHRILKASERLLAAYYECETRLGPEDVYVTEKSVVVRFRLRKCSQHCPASVIAKHILSNPTDRVPRELRFIDECAALKFLNKVAAVPALSPGYYGADRVERVIVMEDLGACYRDTTYQLVRGNDSERAEAAMMTHVAAIGRLHALTIGRRKEYESIRISLGGATEKSHLFQEQWPSARLAKISSFHQALVVATARWHIFKVLRHLNGCLAEDAPRGPTTRRQQFLAWLDVFGSMTEEFAFMTALGKSARAMAVRLRARWPADVHTLPLYPAFRDSRWDQTCHVRLGPG